MARARSIVGELDMLTTDSLAIARGERGRLRIGFTGTLATGDLRATLEDFRREAPEVELEAIEAGRDHLLDALDRDRVDLAVVAGEAPGLRRQSLCLWSEPLALGVMRDHPLLVRDRLYWTDLRGMTFLVTRGDPGDLIAAMIGARLSGAGHAPKIISQAVSRDNLHSFVSHDQLSVTAGAGQPFDSGIVFRDVHDAFGPTRLSQSLHWRPESDNPALARFLSVATRRYGRAPPAVEMDRNPIRAEPFARNPAA